MIGNSEINVVNLDRSRELLGLPFRPFNICLADGRQFGVPRHDYIALGRVIVSMLDQDNVAHSIDALPIVSVDQADGASSRQ